jgi:hypothetical protein
MGTGDFKRVVDRSACRLAVHNLSITALAGLINKVADRLQQLYQQEGVDNSMLQAMYNAVQKICMEECAHRSIALRRDPHSGRFALIEQFPVKED